ncbi:hypothetical protein [Phyllobacterium endophyticum]|uniref:hypothetical protein n=1 Tax=Phyllobacterium endophyticum TaxID=1149773 RepID=UPI0011C93684|nr:hypothetical protein [Phyllobacterium endophyticum]
MIEAETKQERLSEIELELKQGRAAALYQLGLGLLDVSPLCLENPEQICPRLSAGTDDRPNGGEGWILKS